MKKNILMLIFLAVIAVICVICIRFFVLNSDQNNPEESATESQREKSTYKVKCDQDAFNNGRVNYRYEPGSTVGIVFSSNQKNVCSFSVSDVDDVQVDYYPGTGYLIRFVMPKQDVTLKYEITDTPLLDKNAPMKEICIAFDENPTTGFEWFYEMDPEGIVEIVSDYYISDPNPSKEPVDGLGGTRFFKFQVTGTGTVEIRFSETRGDEEFDSYMMYRYECDGTDAVYLESGWINNYE